MKTKNQRKVLIVQRVINSLKKYPIPILTLKQFESLDGAYP